MKTNSVEVEEYRLLIKRPDEKRWKHNGGSVIRSRSAALNRAEHYRTEYGSAGWQFKVQVRKVRIESSSWTDAK